MFVDSNEPITFKCSTCDSSFDFKSQLILHEISHKVRVQCKVCPKKIYEENLQAHMKTHSGRRSYFCDFCERKFETKKLILDHLRSKHVKRKKAVEELKVNIKQEPEYTNINDPLVIKSIAVKQEPIEDMQITPYQPKMSFSTLKNSSRAFSCQHCTKPFNTRAGLLLHEPKCPEISKEKLLKCEFCDETFSDEFTMEIHVNVMHVNAKVHTCSECDFSTTKYFIFRNHKMAHMKLVNCEKCDKTFKTESAMQEHSKKAHGVESMHRCKKCDAVFKKSVYLDRHERTAHGTSIAREIMKTIEFTAAEVNLCTIRAQYSTSSEEVGSLKFLPRNHPAVPGKKSYCNILCSKLSAESATKSHFKITEGWKKSGSFNRVIYVFCDHGNKMAVTYSASQHKFNHPLTFRFKMTCVLCAGLESSLNYDPKREIEEVTVSADKELTLTEAVNLMRLKIMKYLDDVEFECQKEVFPLDYFINKTEAYAGGVQSCVYDVASAIRHQMTEFSDKANGVEDDWENPQEES